MLFISGLIVIALAAKAIFQGKDLRVSLLLAALSMGVMVGISNLIQSTFSPGAHASSGLVMSFLAPLIRMARVFLITFSNEDFVTPICMSMGFAYVLRETGCDQHLVHFLLNPLRKTGSLFLPGVVFAGFVVNIPLISQGATAAAVGTVLIPLGRALKLSPCILGAALVLGSSIGGELLNPGSPELHSVVETLRPTKPDVTTADCVAQVRRLVGWHLLTATALFWFMNRRNVAQVNGDDPIPFRVNLFKAAVPFIPLVVLMLLAPPFQVWHVPPPWLLIDPSNVTEAKTFDSRLIGLAMLLGVAIAVATSPRSVQKVGKSFFDGMGFAFVSIIAMIVSANCFGEGVKMIGLDAVLGRTIHWLPSLLLPLAVAIPMIFGVVSGSGMAATQTLFRLFVGPSYPLGIDPLRTGALVSIGAATGRTMSPVSPVMLISSKLTDVPPFELFRRIAIPMLAGLLVTVLIAKWS